MQVGKPHNAVAINNSKSKIKMGRSNNQLFNVILWILQAVVAVMFIMPGFMKMLLPIQTLSAMLPWTGQVSPYMVRGLGLIDVLGGVGVVLPSLLLVKPQLAGTVAIACILLMISAIIFHISRGEASVIGFNIVVIFILAFIAWGRNIKAPIQSK